MRFLRALSMRANAVIAACVVGNTATRNGKETNFPVVQSSGRWRRWAKICLPCRKKWHPEQSVDPMPLWITRIGDTIAPSLTQAGGETEETTIIPTQKCIDFRPQLHLWSLYPRCEWTFRLFFILHSKKRSCLFAEMFTDRSAFKRSGVPGNEILMGSGTSTPHVTVIDSPVMNLTIQTLEPTRLILLTRLGSTVLPPSRIFRMLWRLSLCIKIFSCVFKRGEGHQPF